MTEGTRIHKILAVNEYIHNQTVNAVFGNREERYYLIEQSKTLLSLMEDEHKTIPLWVEEQYKQLVIC